MSRISKEAQRDALEYVRAEMYYGEGAGVRRRQIFGAVNYKMDHIPGYEKAFGDARARVDHVKQLKFVNRQRSRRDLAKASSRTAKALARGDKRGMPGKVAVIVTVASIAHATGYDRKALAWGKKKYADLKQKWDNRDVE